MTVVTRRILLGCLTALVLGLGSALAAPPSMLRIMAPASPGGGWDGTSRAMQAVLQQTGVVPQVEVFNVPGAGGTVGLAQLATTEKGNGDILMMMGLVMVGSILTNDAPVTLDQSTPIARLTAEYEVVVVPASSKYQTLGDLLADFKADPGSVAWAGGSAGGIDHILVGLIAQEVGVDPKAINYIPFSGGGE
ncbi:MAG TPA: tripartite tricarboxylate transporter substrate-binding protein, partial [Trueperaceae bacterium]